MPTLSLRQWFKPSLSQPERSLDLVRVVVAIVLLIHPLYALAHPGDIRGLGQFLSSRGFPLGQPLAWAVMVLQIGCSLALLARRFLTLACTGHLVVLAMGIWLVHAPNWYALGGAAEDGHPGAEYNVLLMICLLALMWAQGRVQGAAQSREPGPAASQGLRLVQAGAALVLITHPLHGFTDPSGLREFGHGLEKLGFPMGVPLVWTLMFVQTGSCLALVARRLVVPACAAHIFVLSMGIWIAHAPRWFVVGPGENGMEYSVVLITCFFAVLLAYWPQMNVEASSIRA